MLQNVIVVGACGKVGSTLVRQIFERKDFDSKVHTNPTRIIGLVSYSDYLFNSKGISQKDCLEFTARKEDFSKKPVLDKVISIAKKTKFPKREEVVFVDVTASKQMLSFHQDIIRKTKFSLVTANKNPLALCSFEEFKELTKSPARYSYRCSVMAGAESINFVQDLKDLNDSPTLIQGCFSGTLALICNELEKGKLLSEIIKEAKEKGYTEPHPRDDLNGLDVARKILILARTAGYNVNLDDIQLEPFIPKNYFEKESIEEFIKTTKELDEEYSKKVKNASKKGSVLRYIAELESVNGKPKMSISLKEVPKDSVLGLLKGTSNKIVVISKAYPKSTPYVVEAPGAGLEVTAQNIRRDLLSQLLPKRKVF